jgi:hypothetical protein
MAANKTRPTDASVVDYILSRASDPSLEPNRHTGGANA